MRKNGKLATLAGRVKEKEGKEQVKLTRINVENVPCYCSIGINETEKKTGQRLLIDVYVDVDSSRLAGSDNVNDTLSYVEIYKTIQRVAHSKSHSLIEVLAEDLVESFLKYEVAKVVKVVVHKPHIPFPEFQGDVSVEVKREK